MREVPTDPGEITKMMYDRDRRRTTLLLKKKYPKIPPFIARPIECVRANLGLLTKIEKDQQTRRGKMLAKEVLTFFGITRLKGAKDVLGDNGLFYDPSERAVTEQDADAIAELYRQTGIARENPGLFDHLQLTRLYAMTIGKSLNEGEHHMNPHALGAMGLLRNISSFFGEAGYHRKQLVSAQICRQLSIHDTYIRYLRPPTVDAGPLRRSDYHRFSKQELQSQIDRRCMEIYQQLTPEQKVVEIAGLMAKKDREGRLMSFERVLMELAHPTRRSREAYEQHVGQEAVFFSERYPLSTFSDEFVEGWIDIYCFIAEEFRAKGADLDHIHEMIVQMAEQQPHDFRE